MSHRNKQKQLWADELFIQKLEQIKAKRLLIGKPVRNTGELTREIAESDAFRKLEEELLNDKHLGRATEVRIRFDGFLR